jgi:5-methylcytosine-specific restriction endonuclease McrA
MSYSRSFRLPRPRDENGKRICAVPRCLKPLPKGRKSWCSDEHMWLGYKTLSRFAGAIHWRDGGICALCGLDCDWIRAWLDYYRRIDQPLYLSATAVLEAEGFDLDVYELWEADHIVPLCEGGKNLMENGRILCHPCHKRVTREMHARRKQNRTVQIGLGL